jgi:hypothetical protein
MNNHDHGPRILGFGVAARPHAAHALSKGAPTGLFTDRMTSEVEVWSSGGHRRPLPSWVPGIVLRRLTGIKGAYGVA